MSDSLLASTDAHLRELTRAVWDGQCVAFVGAGFSAAAHLPGWIQLLEAAACEVPDSHPDADEARY